MREETLTVGVWEVEGLVVGVEVTDLGGTGAQTSERRRRSVRDSTSGQGGPRHGVPGLMAQKDRPAPSPARFFSRR